MRDVEFSLRTLPSLTLKPFIIATLVKEGKGIMEYLESERQRLGSEWTFVGIPFIFALWLILSFLEPGV